MLFHLYLYHDHVFSRLMLNSYNLVSCNLLAWDWHTRLSLCTFRCVITIGFSAIWNGFGLGKAKMDWPLDWNIATVHISYWENDEGKDLRYSFSIFVLTVSSGLRNPFLPLFFCNERSNVLSYFYIFHH